MKLMIETKSVPSATVKKKAQEAADVVPPRVYVNSTMPNGSQEYWQRAMSWGR